ncbi:MAG TPA: hypothetical protein VKJ47_17155 [Candidatus Binatia bacterium]|nr:hypothetical protein [Candidatus Binatia bacterium]
MKWWSAALSLLVWLWGGTCAHAAGNVFEQASLKGLKAVQVVVENLAPDVSQDGLDRSQIKTAVEQQLQQAHIPVEAQAENALYIHLGTIKNDAGLYSYSLSLQLLQLVLLWRDPGLVTWGTTWSLSQVGAITPVKLGELDALIARGVNAFIEDYQTVNPTPQ